MKRIAESIMDSLKGKFLIATPRLDDPNFEETVVLIVQHDDNGALGLVVNRPMEVTLQQACEQVLGAGCEVSGVLHHGGPCDAMLVAVHTHALAGEIEIMPGLFFTTSKDQVEELLENAAVEKRFFVGYSGWSAGQLEAEFETGSWQSVPASPERVFGPPEKLWGRLNAEASLSNWVNPENIPDDPSMN